MTDFTYLRALIEYYDILKWKNRTTTNPDSILAHLKKTYTLVDPHARELQFGRDGRSFYFPLEPEFLPYWEANGQVHSEVYEMTSNFAKAQALGEKMKNSGVQTDSAIQSVHPYFQPILRAFNDTTRVFAERLQREAKDRIMTAPDVPGDQLLQAIAKQYPGKVVFFDLCAALTELDFVADEVTAEVVVSDQKCLNRVQGECLDRTCNGGLCGIGSCSLSLALDGSLSGGSGVCPDLVRGRKLKIFFHKIIY
jgi:hypothetical protein